MENKPLVSVITACYNAEKYLKNTIDSILCQSYLNFEYIIVNDGSIDKSEEIILSYNDNRIEYYYQENAGPGAARNFAISKAKGEYLMIVDADDVSVVNRMRIQVEYLENNLNFVGVGGCIDVITEDGEYIYTKSAIISSSEINNKFQNDEFPMFHPTMMFVSEVVKKVGSYPIDTSHGEDYFMMKKMNEYGDWGNLSISLIKYRLTPFSLTNKTSKVSKKVYKLIEKRKTKELSKKEVNYLLHYSKNINQEERMAAYYLHVASLLITKSKNYNKAFQYMKKAIIIKPSSIISIVVIVVKLLYNKFYSLIK